MVIVQIAEYHGELYRDLTLPLTCYFHKFKPEMEHMYL